MTPEDSSPSDPASDVVSDATLPGNDDLRAVIARLTSRVFALEQALLALPQPSADGKSTNAALLTSSPLLASRPQQVGSSVATAKQVPISSDEVPLKPSPSLEDRLGSQIFNRVGIIAILVGATWFLKLAIDNHWIGPLGRVLIGLLAGIGIVGWSESFRRKEFAAFSYSLKAVGSGILYLSLWASFHLYHLLPAGIAFALMLLVTLWNAWMAWSQQSEVLAAYAISGAFSTPALLSTGGNHQVFLFSYLLSIDVASIVLVRLASMRSKVWSRLLIATISATIVYFISWYSHFYTADQLASTSVFITLFFAAFFTVPLRLHASTPSLRPEAEPISDILLPLANAIFASLAFYSVLEDSGNHAALSWVALCFAAIYLSAMRLPILGRMQTTVASAVHLSLAVLFLTIAIPLKASGRWITIGWLAEGVALLWVSARLAENHTGSGLSGATAHLMLRRLASVALTLGFFGLLITPFWFDGSTRIAFFNRRFATELAGVAAFAVATWIAVRAKSVHGSGAERLESAFFPNWLQIASASVVTLNLIALQAGIAEIQTFWSQNASAIGNEASLQTALSTSGFLMLYGAGLLAVGFWRHNPFLRWQGLGLLVVAILKTFLYDVRSLSQGYRVASFLGLGVLLMAVSFVYVRKSGTTSTHN